MVKTRYSLRIELYGMPAYIIDELLQRGLHGVTRENVLEHIVSEALNGRLDEFARSGITYADAERKGYVPIKIKQEKTKRK